MVAINIGKVTEMYTCGQCFGQLLHLSQPNCSLCYLLLFALYFTIFSPLYVREFISLLSDSSDDDLDANFQEAIQASLEQATDGSHVSSHTKYAIIDCKHVHILDLTVVF